MTVEKLMKTAWGWNREALFSKVKYVEHKELNTFILSDYKDILEYKHVA